MMDRQYENPAALAGANRVIKSQAFSKSSDQNHTEEGGHRLAVRMISQRYRISISRALTVCELAGIGGDA